MRVGGWRQKSSMEWGLTIQFALWDRFISISGKFIHTYWCIYFRWDGR
jgi:hypothetical protein